MKRHLTRSDLEDLTTEDYRLLVTEQFETHRRLREQAQSIIRMIISGIGIVVALLGYKLYPDFQLPSRSVTSQGGNLQFDGLVQSVANNSIFVASLFAILAVGLLFFSVMKSIAVLSSDGPVPVSRHKSLDRELNSNVNDGTDGRLSEWILTNDARIVEAERQVEQSYTNIWAAFFIGFVAVALTFTGLLGWLPAMGAIHFLLVVGGPVVFIYYIKDSLVMFGSNVRDHGFRSAFSDSVDVFYDRMHHRGPDFTVKMLFILFYGVYLEYSINAAVVWVTLFVL